MAKKKQAAPAVNDLPADHLDRQRILDELDTTMLVEAAAGTGKTTSLVGRMVALLRQGKCPVDTLAAVTFTRKSTAELRARFQVALEQAAASESGPAGQRLAEALLHVERCFIGTIHSFCARLLRERPVEAAVDPGFTELEDTEDFELRDEAWEDYVAGLYATGDPILAELDDLGIEIGQLHDAFGCLAGYPDVEEWPTPEIELTKIEPVVKRILEYIRHMETLAPFPNDRGTDQLMNLYERIPRLVRRMNQSRRAEVMNVLAEFRDVTVTQKCWPGGKSQGKQEKIRWENFAQSTAVPEIDLWLQRRYDAVIRALRPAVQVYDRLRKAAGGLNFQDLLLRAAALLRDKPSIRKYFRKRFTHLLVDEFQDTDPIQAEVMLLLTADDPNQQDWRRCRPVAGSLFVVGDPKQSIYRFRRADIVTYSKVKEIVLAAGGAVVPLTANFRTTGTLVNWANTVFDQVFPQTANAYSPATCPMQIGRPGESDGQLQGLYVLEVPDSHGDKEGSLEYESDFVARTIRQALDQGLTLPRTPKEVERGAAPAAVPGDFMIITRGKKHLAFYARKLSELGIPQQVTGGSALGQVGELALLSKCLVAVAEPENPVALVAALRGELFGASDAALYAFRKAGGRFDFRTEIPTDLSDAHAETLGDAFARLKHYREWLRRLPPVPAFERIAADLGLPMLAAASIGGNVQAGSLAKAMEMLRAAQEDLHSTADLTQYLGKLIEENREFDAVPARPHDAPTVRLMNLHKVKGLEAPVVFLSDPTGEYDHEIQLHIDRSGDKVKGYLAVLGPASGRQKKPLLAMPSDWDNLSEEERKFQSAEKQRLMYVAATRAGAALVIVRRAKDNKWNPWKFFDGYLMPPYLAVDRQLIDPGPQVRPVADEFPVSGPDVTAAIDAVATRWDHAAAPSYATVAAKEQALSPSRLHFHATTGEHGTEWGTVIHLLLQTALERPDADLRQLARLALTEEDLDANLADSALEMVNQVLRSDVLRRARSAEQYLVEVPFQKLLPAGGPGAVDGLPTVVRGVIDLAFHEPAGWVIVDYKTDRIASSQVSVAAEHYRAQVDAYAHTWHEMLNQPVHERGLYFTHIDRYVRL